MLHGPSHPCASFSCTPLTQVTRFSLFHPVDPAGYSTPATCFFSCTPSTQSTRRRPPTRFYLLHAAVPTYTLFLLHTAVLINSILSLACTAAAVLINLICLIQHVSEQQSTEASRWEMSAAGHLGGGLAIFAPGGSGLNCRGGASVVGAGDLVMTEFAARRRCRSFE